MSSPFDESLRVRFELFCVKHFALHSVGIQHRFRHLKKVVPALVQFLFEGLNAPRISNPNRVTIANSQLWIICDVRLLKTGERNMAEIESRPIEALKILLAAGGSTGR